MLRLLFPYLLFGFMVLVVVFDNVGGRSELRSEPVSAVAQGICPPCGMSVDQEVGIAREIDGGVMMFCSEGCADEFLASLDGISLSDGPAATVGRDPVCQMDVGSQIASTFEGVQYYFCTDQCRDLFLADPISYSVEACPVCLADEGARTPVAADFPAFTWQRHTYHFCTTAHRDSFAADPAGYFMHSMWGIPTWLYGVSIGVILLLSFGLFELISRWSRKRAPTHPRINLLRIPGLTALIRWPGFRFLLQSVLVFFFGLIILAGLFGDQLAGRNIAPLLTWTIWWGGLVVLIMFFGKAWCYVCPWDAISRWVERLKLWGKSTGGIGLGLKWPRHFRTIAIATVFFVGLTWLELGFGVTNSPRATALLALGMLTMTLVCALIFERQSFCRYACLVGRVSGLYAMFSSTEVRAADRSACSSCATKDCYHGNEKGDGCPTGLLPGTLTQNTYCIDCLECVKTCPTDNMVINARPWAADLATQGRPRKDEAILALLMLAITGFHGLTMTPVWRQMLDTFENGLALPYIPAFSLGMFLLMLAPVLIYALLLKLTVTFSRTPGVSYKKAFIAFAYSLLPIALFYHLAHNLEHMLIEGQKIVPLMSNPFGFAPGEAWNILGFAGVGSWDLFGTADWTLAPLVTLPTLWLLQALLVLVGHVYSLWVADHTARRLYPATGNAMRSQLPMLVGMVLFSMFSLWLLKQPMEMRTSAM